MGDTKAFTTLFNLTDNFSRKFDAIQARMRGITGKTVPINFEVSKGITGNLDAVQKKIEASQMAATGWNNALGRAAMGAKNAADATKNIGDETQKTTGFLGNMQSKLDGVGGVADNLRDKFGAITGLLAGGSIGGMSWLNAMTSEKADKSFERRMARKRIDTSTVDAFIDKAEGVGYTTKSTRQDIADTILSRTKLRGPKMESTTKAIEDLYAQNSYDLNKKGITSAQDFAELLTKKTMGPGDKQTLIDLGIKGTSVSSRLRSAQKQAVGIDETKLAAEDPYQSFLNRMSETSGKVGKTLIEPMNMVLEKVNGILDLVNTIPGAPGLIALAAVLTAAAGGASILLAVLQPLGGALKGLKIAEGMSGITKLFSGGGSLLAGGPLLILLALAAILLVVAYRTGVLGKAWDKFNQSAIGKDVMSGLMGISDVAGGLIDRFEKWYEATGRNEFLATFFLFVEILGNAWDYVDKIYSTMRGGGASPILAALTAISAAPLALGMGIAKTVTGKDPGELLGYLIEQDQRWISYLITNFPLFGKIYEIIKKVHSVMEWLYSLLQGALAWIRDGLGITKKEKEAKMNKLAEKEGLVWKEPVGDHPGGWWKGSAPASASGSGVDPGTLEKLNKAREAWQKAPKGFFEGIPGINDLIAALNKLTEALKVKIPEAVTNAGNNYVAQNAAKYEKTKEKSGEYIATQTTWRPWWMPGGGLYDAGGTVHRSGSAVIHRGEEIVPPASATRGPGAISRAIAALDAVTTGRSSAAGAGADTYSIQVTNHNDFSGMKVSNGMDLEKLFVKIDKRIEAKSVEAVKKAIGQGRT